MRSNAGNVDHYWRNRERLNNYKLERGCVDCGYVGHPQALQFDHVRGVKRFNIGSKVKLAWSTLLDEIAKCDVVCANCHAVRTAERRRAA